MDEQVAPSALITSDAVTFGILAAILGLLFWTRSLGGRWAKFYGVVPIILLCYLIPSLLTSFNVITSETNLWQVAKDYFLPAALILLTLSIDMKAVIGLGPKALIMFFTATVGIVIGGPIAVALVGTFSPETVGGEGADAAWRGLATVAGSWIGGGANQTAMLEVYGYNIENYAAMVAVDIVVANIWMAFLLYGAGNPEPIDRWLKADTSAITRLQTKMADYSASIERVSKTEDFMVMVALTFAGVGLSHLVALLVGPAIAALPGMEESVLTSGFFWVVVVATTYGLALSFTRARQLEGAGASKLGTVFIFLLVTIIGTKMDIFSVAERPLLFLVGIIWMLVHTILLFTVAKMIRAPFFFIAVGSKANVGGAASAPVLAAAFHPALAPVGVLLAVLGYALGTYGAILCAEMMRVVVGG
ncbi:DUF819 domain-containing protein [Sphingomicrobium astaxanthinifaciens]|uniref:DUF819 family protein n=1 Tax=Sphingomicrobium astaxanthinifaciens TaxID=1227949 RepID=UPI001FCB5C80|nr:DUF819 family protein [Sphingomicrobium astaxanthinifaciens]MCJ7422396.1 DUF819 family protein [Sphingomicrobium astaxanthinifaciens]